MSIEAITSDVAPGSETSAAGRKLGVALLVIASAQLMLTLDSTIVNVALPSMERSLQLPLSHLNWVASFYALSFGGLLLAGACAGDLYGRLRLFRFGLVVFAAASMAGGLAPNGCALDRLRGKGKFRSSRTGASCLPSARFPGCPSAARTPRRRPTTSGCRTWQADRHGNGGDDGEDGDREPPGGPGAGVLVVGVRRICIAP